MEVIGNTLLLFVLLFVSTFGSEENLKTRLNRVLAVSPMDQLLGNMESLGGIVNKFATKDKDELMETLISENFLIRSMNQLCFNPKEEDIISLIHLFSKEDREKLLEFILAEDNGITSLCAAAKRGFSKVIKILLNIFTSYEKEKMLAWLTKSNRDDSTALLLIVIHVPKLAAMEVVPILLNSFPSDQKEKLMEFILKPNFLDSGMNPVNCAILYEKLEVLEILLCKIKQLNPDVFVSEHYLLVQSARKKGNSKVLKLLQKIYYPIEERIKDLIVNAFMIDFQNMTIQQEINLNDLVMNAFTIDFQNMTIQQENIWISNEKVRKLLMNNLRENTIDFNEIRNEIMMSMTLTQNKRLYNIEMLLMPKLEDIKLFSQLAQLKAYYTKRLNHTSLPSLVLGMYSSIEKLILSFLLNYYEIYYPNTLVSI